MTIRFGPQLCTDLSAGARREWLVTDGLGGYAMGTVSGLRTRRYHGLLIMADPEHGPARRYLGLASLDATVTLESGRTVRLGVHEWADGTVDPCGHELLTSFDLADGVPRWRWQIGSVVIEREIAMRHGEPSVAVVHRLVSGGPVELTLAVLGTWRDVHGERTAQGPPPQAETTADGVIVEGAYRVQGDAEWRAKGEWWFGVRHREEAERGLTPVEDLWHLGEYSGRLDRPGQSIGVTASAEGTRVEPAEMTVERARDRGRRLGDDGRAADQFVIRTPTGPDVVAGYPWFGAWGRDTMISYEGLFLTTGRVEEGRQLLRNYAATLSEGMLANTCDTGSREYNTADATLWFLHAVDRHAQVDPDLAEELRSQVRSVVDHHTWGTRYAIKMDPVDGLLSQGAEGEALTWMDARVGGVPVTPRAGKAVDINALWVNGLAGLAERWPEDGYRQLHDRARQSFQRFVRPDGLLHDVLDQPEPGVRPNQLLAWSLPHAPLTPAADPLRRLTEQLLTPMGLRSLSPAADGYRGRHRGTPADRDRAYHQGTVWPWLLGPLADAVSKTQDTAVISDGIRAHRSEYGLGSVSETADGDAPHGATGCPFQAWSVAETTRVTE
ncbi:amylo-alpha-1,6-glucosidase [Hamadaea sp. NPDC051192]|uniref:amylo-alpha-1,6-glucosidase n=1 Tax=Hamadaea sp. NPDC051192 TaxID=3154940 RepID=UPI00342D20D6